MARYPDIFNNPDGDPRIYQQQYDDWCREREQEEYEKEQYEDWCREREQEEYEKEKYQQSQEVDNSLFDR